MSTLTTRVFPRSLPRPLLSIWALGGLLCLIATACSGGGRRAPDPSPSRESTAPVQTPTRVDGCDAGHQRLEARDYGAAATTFDDCATARPDEPYAYYYAGMSYREIGRVDLMTLRFERFIELAPGAPERPRVQAILRNVTR